VGGGNNRTLACRFQPALNTLDFGNFNLTGTLYYTSGYSLAEVDYGGDPNDCAGLTATDGPPDYQGTDPIPTPAASHPNNTYNLGAACRAKATWQLRAEIRNSTRGCTDDSRCMLNSGSFGHGHLSR